MKYPKISIVTPCFNMEKYIEGTIISVLGQRYPNLEYIIVDGGSKDNTMEIVEKYRTRLTKVISEPDNGMYDAIHKGFSIATGEILCWLNADDQSLPWAFHVVGNIFSQFPDVNWIMGLPAFLNEERMLTCIYDTPAAIPQRYIANGWCRSEIRGFLQQESMFWRRELYEKAGCINSCYRAAADFELWMRMAKHSELTTLNIPLSAFMQRRLSLSKATKLYDEEMKQILADFPKYPSFLWKLGAKCMPLKAIMRLCSIHAAPVIYYSQKHNNFIFSRKRRSVSGNSIGQIYQSVMWE